MSKKNCICTVGWFIHNNINSTKLQYPSNRTAIHPGRSRNDLGNSLPRRYRGDAGAGDAGSFGGDGEGYSF